MIEPAPVARLGKQSRRNLTLMDLIVLVAGVAIGAAWLRAVQPALVRNPPNIMIGNPPNIMMLILDFAYQKVLRPYDQIFPFVAGLMIATLALRFLAPRPSLRLLIRQRGWTACLAATISFAVQWVFLGLLSLYLKFSLSVPLTNRVVHEILENYGLGVGSFDPGPYILTVWVTQAVMRRRVAAVDWVDRSGRLLGWCCVLGTTVRVVLEVVLGLHYRGFFPP